MTIAYQIKVAGRVQGVGFRYYTKLEADKLGIRGTVRNEKDGSVIIEVVGKEEDVNEFLRWCHKGPPTALVDSLNYNNIPMVHFDNFEILR